METLDESKEDKSKEVIRTLKRSLIKQDEELEAYKKGLKDQQNSIAKLLTIIEKIKTVVNSIELHKEKL